jgi:cytoskeletal protein RodZ
MSEKESQTREWTDPKDFGLPFVEINLTPPLEGSSPSNPIQSDTSAEGSISSPASKHEQEVKGNFQVNFDKPEVKKAKEKNYSSAWVWIVIALALACVGVILWQINQTNSFFGESESEKLSQSQELPIDKTEEDAEPSEPASITQINESKDSISVITNSNSSISQESEIGTTIANESSSTDLIRIDSKAERVRFFVVVASLPNEELALEMVEKFSSKSAELYLILPYGSTPNYRIAVSQFKTWKAASEEAERIRPQFSDDLWILNY